tara:strand:+ start:1464 stop:2633 length:1170 start_codon:yes stop_codon:yes gene_type:complete
MGTKKSTIIQKKLFKDNMKILLLEPYYTGSHKQWADGYKHYSDNEIRILKMRGQFWKWRMHGGAITLAKKFNKMSWQPDRILSTDMLDLTTFLALTKHKTSEIPTAIYFHENQLSYPWSHYDRDVKNKRDSHYGFINYSSALAADRLFFNSKFHLDSFVNSTESFLKQFPDYQEKETSKVIEKKSEVLYIGIDFKEIDKYKVSKDDDPIIIWNHRWEYDKNPKLFFDALEIIKKEGHKFKLVILGENFSKTPEIFNRSKKYFKDHILHWGYADSFEEYAKWLWRSHILPVTSNQEFFGVSVMEAIYCGIWPILPKRLTYPELIPNNSDNFYGKKEELCQKIKWALQNYQMIDTKNLQNRARMFCWRNMKNKYDQSMRKISINFGDLFKQ